MTVIAWDGSCLATDKRTSFANTISTTTKLERLPDGTLVACAGIASRCNTVRRWFREGRKPEDYPSFQNDAAECCDIVCVEADGRIHIYQCTVDPVLIEDRFISFGSGSNYAMAAMHLGFNAIKAVETANALDSSCGNGYDALFLRYNDQRLYNESLTPRNNVPSDK